jgi:hypothetical protein
MSPFKIIAYGKGVFKREYSSGTTEWYLNTKLHREDAPARDWSEGKEWYLYGKRHREDGPAIEMKDGDKAWYLNGKELSEKEFNSIALEKELNKDLSINETKKVKKIKL